MKIYEVKTSLHKPEVGSVPQISGTTVSLSQTMRREYLTLDRRAFPMAMPDLDIFMLDASAKATDLLSSSYTQLTAGIVVNENVMQVLEGHQAHNARSYTMSVTTNDGTRVYPYYFYYVLEAPELIDFTASEFYNTNLVGDERYAKVPVDSAQGYYDCFSQMKKGIVAPVKVALRHVPDLFRLPWQANPFISENLKNRFEQLGISGLKIHSPDIAFSLS